MLRLKLIHVREKVKKKYTIRIREVDGANKFNENNFSFYLVST